MRLAIVTATTDLGRSKACRDSWTANDVDIYTVCNGTPPVYSEDQRWEFNRTIFGGDRWYYQSDKILGTVPAFAIGVQKALEEGAEIIACFHDDLRIDQSWAIPVRDWFTANPRCGLAGFGGATGLGHPEIYKLPYDPMQLARVDFVSNMKDAEAHGRRATTSTDYAWGYLAPERVACLDGFSQIGRRAFWQGRHFPDVSPAGPARDSLDHWNLFTMMQSWGVIHHFYDGMLGAFAARLGWEAWMLPIKCHHFGGQTAVGDAKYQAWVAPQGGDGALWTKAHEIGYHEFKDVLPLRVT